MTRMESQLDLARTLAEHFDLDVQVHMHMNKEEGFTPLYRLILDGFTLMTTDWVVYDLYFNDADDTVTHDVSLLGGFAVLDTMGLIQQDDDVQR